MSFGKRQVPGADFRASQFAEPSRAAPAPAFSAPALDRAERDRWLIILLMIVPGFFAVESLLSSSSLITPISTTFLWCLRAVGLAVGIALMVVLCRTDDFQANSLGRKWLTIIVCPLLMAFAFGEMGWRMADWWEFAGSDARWETAAYPIASLHHGRRSAYDSIEIDPFNVGETTDIPVSRDQYKALLETSSGQCVQVSHRRAADGAIEIRTDGRHNLSPPPEAIVGPC